MVKIENMISIQYKCIVKYICYVLRTGPYTHIVDAIKCPKPKQTLLQLLSDLL